MFIKFVLFFDEDLHIWYHLHPECSRSQSWKCIQNDGTLWKIMEWSCKYFLMDKLSLRRLFSPIKNHWPIFKMFWVFRNVDHYFMPDKSLCNVPSLPYYINNIYIYKSESFHAVQEICQIVIAYIYNLYVPLPRFYFFIENLLRDFKNNLL